MRFTSSQSDLGLGLSLVSRAVPSRPSSPVLGNVLLAADVETQEVSVRAFDNELGIQTVFSALVSKPGAVALPAKSLGDIVSRLPEGEVQLTLDTSADSNLVTLTSGTGGDRRYQFQGMPAEDFPELPAVVGDKAIALPAETILAGLRATLFAASTEQTKQVLTGVHIKFTADSVELAATDGHRLVVLELANTSNETTLLNDFEVTIPARSLRELERILKLQASDDRVELRADSRQVVFSTDEQVLTSRRLDGDYPAYQQLIPRQFNNQINLDRRQFQGALERIAVLAERKNNVVKFTLDGDNQQLLLSVDAQDVGSGREALPVQMTNSEPRDIAFNVKYLMDGLKALNSTEIAIHLNTATQPAIFKPIGDWQMTYLVMPVQLRDL